MSRIGKKPIPLPTGVKYEVKGNTVTVNGEWLANTTMQKSLVDGAKPEVPS